MKKTFYLFNPGILERKDNTLKFTPCAEEGEDMSVTSQPRYLPVEDISEFYVFGSLRANSSLFNFLGQKDIAVHFFDYYENYTGSFMPRDSLLSGRMLLAQTSYYQNLKKRMCIAQKFIEGAAYNMIKNLQYYNRRGKDMEELIDLMKKLSSQISQTSNTEELMGIEGQIRQYYYAAFNLILNDFEMGNRTKRPPQNDIAEIFKPILVDRVIFKVLNRKEIQEKHFDRKLNKCLLNSSGKKIFVKALEDRLQETIQHRSLKRSVSYRHLVKLECYKLAKHLLAMEEYKPFKMYW